MKRILLMAAVVVALQACGSGHGGEGGTTNDGMNTVDTNGALNDGPGPLTDSTGNAIENSSRTDLQQRDTSTTQGQ